MHMKRLLFVLIAIVLFSGGIVVSSGYMFYDPEGVVSDTGYIFYVEPEETAASLLDKLEEADVIKYPMAAAVLFELKSYRPSRHPGRYRILGKESLVDLTNRLRIGEQTPVRLVFNTMRTVQELCGVVASSLRMDSTELAVLLEDSVYISSLGFTEKTLPAMFVPNTYNIWWTCRPEEFLSRMKKEYDDFWNASRRAKAGHLGLTPIEVSVLASIVDEESARTSEYPMIAGVYLNRLKRGMKLDADPTLKFAAGDFTLRRVLDVHKMIDSPYNTYRYAGLPPGPIRIPSIQAIEAVLSPAEHDYLYFCANSDFSGTHVFAKSIYQHNINADKYRLALNRRKIFK